MAVSLDAVKQQADLHFSHAQEETQEYAEEDKLKQLVATYSQFIDFPIYLYTSKEVEVEAAEEAASDEAADEDVSDAEDVTDGETLSSVMPLPCEIFMTPGMHGPQTMDLIPAHGQIA